MAHLLPKPFYRRRLTTARMFGQTRTRLVFDAAPPLIHNEIS